MSSKKFIRTREEFVCERCGFHLTGNGYTNHCPQCLWSKHVDIYPGDRKENCAGLMEPVSIELKRGNYVLTHQCCLCGLKKKNKAASNDNLNILLDKGNF